MNEREVAEDHRQMVDTYRQHRHDLVRFATVLVGPDAAQDVVSSAVLRVLERDPAPVERPKAYLYQAVATRRAITSAASHEDAAAKRELPAPRSKPRRRSHTRRYVGPSNGSASVSEP